MPLACLCRHRTPQAAMQDLTRFPPHFLIYSLLLCYNRKRSSYPKRWGPVKNSSPQQPDTVPSLHHRRRITFLGLLFLLLLAVGISIIRHPTFLSLFGISPPQEQKLNAREEDDTDAEIMTVATPSSEETTTSKFRSGGLGLTRTSWEVLHGRPESSDPHAVVYQDNTYKVTYQRELVWQIEKSWGTTAPTPQQARARIRRYLPLDSHLTETLTKSDGLIVDIYHSHMLAQLLSPQPAEPPQKKAKRRQKDLPTESCVVVHQLSKQKVTSTLLHVGAPKSEGYLPPQS